MAVKIPVNPENEGDLTEVGYHVNKSSRARHRALAKAVERHGADRVWHELHAGYIRNQNENPEAAAVMRADRNFVEMRFRRRSR